MRRNGDVPGENEAWGFSLAGSFFGFFSRPERMDRKIQESPFILPDGKTIVTDF